MRSELASLLAQLAYAGEREHLEAAGVGEYGAVPRVEAVQAARLAQGVETGAQVEVVGVAQDNLGFHLLPQLAEVHTLHAAACAHGHEDGGAYLSVVGGDEAGAGI